MLKLLKANPTEEAYADVFIARYERLLAWSMKLTDQDRPLAEDLVHNTFVQFMLNQPDLNAVENLEGYLYTMLRNTNISRIRRASQKPQHNLALIEYDSAEIGLRAVDLRARLEVQEELWNVCHYACLRKESSKAGSVLILRFFHGYYPSEISKVIRTSRQTVDSWLRLARGEAQLYLEDPNSLISNRENSTAASNAISRVRSSSGECQESEFFLATLKVAIFATRQGPCLSSKEIRRLYTDESPEATLAAVPTEYLGHIVSCPRCLDVVNKLLGLPLLSDRDPTNMLGPDSRGTGGTGGGFSGPPKKRPLQRCLSRFHETFEHRPKELRIAVNGYVLATQKIDAELNEQELNLDAEGKVNFVEVFSEQNFRLMLLNVDAPPDGAFEQQHRIALSDDRSIEASLSFGGTWPRLNVTYRDPLIRSELDPQSVIAQEPDSVRTGSGSDRLGSVRTGSGSDQLGSVRTASGSDWLGSVSTGSRSDRVGSVSTASGSDRVKLPRFRANAWNHLRSWLHTRLSTPDWRLFLRPGTVTAVIALLLVGALLFLQLQRGAAPPASAVVLLARSATAEEEITSRKDQVLHRTINLEEKSATGQLLARRKIEVWQSAAKGITARRLYDERGSLIAGDWRRPDGAQTLYHHGQRPRVQPMVERAESTTLNFDNVWQVSPSAKEFTSLVENSDLLTFEETPSSYVITYEKQSSNGEAQGLLNATLTLSRADLHAVAQTLTIRRVGETREYNFLETSFERRLPTAVAPAVFEPDPELLSERMKDEGGRMKETANSLSRFPLSPFPRTASTELEVEVLGLLQQAGADLGEQVSVTRSPEGALYIKGLVDTDKRKSEILRALEPVRTNPAVKIEVSTAAEALARQRRRQSVDSTSVVEQVQPAENRLPVHRELRRYLLKRGISEGEIEAESSRLAIRMSARSRQVLQHAWALKRLGERFSLEDLRTLDSQTKERWLGMVRSHAAAIQRESAALRGELQAIFPMPAAGGSPEFDPGSDAALVQAIKKLFDLCSRDDQVVRAAFTVSADPSGGAAIKSPQFWQSLLNAEVLAGKIVAVARQ